MLRSSLLVLLAAALAASSLALSWGEKEVTHERCALERETGQRVCTTRTTIAHYDPTVLRGTVSSWEHRGDRTDGPESRTFWHRYDEATAPGFPAGSAWWHSPILAAARPLLLAGAVVGPTAVAAAWVLPRARRRSAPVALLARHAHLAPLAAVLTLAAGPLAALGGMALHAGTWAATRVEPLQPMPGTWVLAAAGILGLAGGVRMHDRMRDAAAGRTAASPLVPVADLYGFDEADEEPAAPERERAPDGVPWRWPRGGTLALTVAVLLLLPLGAPLASKDITLRDCPEVEGRGAVCSSTSLAVTYHAAHAALWEVHVRDGPVPETALAPAGALHYLGAWQERHGGPAWMGLGALLLAPGGLAVAAWFAAAGRTPHAPGLPALRTGGLALLALGFLLAVAAVAVQAGTWVGAPAGRSTPHVGAWSGLLGCLLLAGTALRARRHHPGRTTPSTATTTSAAD